MNTYIYVGRGGRFIQHLMSWADHVVILYPLWLGSMPALLKALLEQMLRPGFAFSTLELGKWPVKFLSGKSARIIMTMGMPAPIPLVFSCPQLAQPAADILKFVGFRSIRSTLIGNVAGLSKARRTQWLDKVRTLGRAAAFSRQHLWRCERHVSHLPRRRYGHPRMESTSASVDTVLVLHRSQHGRR